MRASHMSLLTPNMVSLTISGEFMHKYICIYGRFFSCSSYLSFFLSSQNNHHSIIICSLHQTDSSIYSMNIIAKPSDHMSNGQISGSISIVKVLVGSMNTSVYTGQALTWNQINNTRLVNKFFLFLFSNDHDEWSYWAVGG